MTARLPAHAVAFFSAATGFMLAAMMRRRVVPLQCRSYGVIDEPESKFGRPRSISGEGLLVVAAILTAASPAVAIVDDTGQDCSDYLRSAHVGLRCRRRRPGPCKYL